MSVILFLLPSSLRQKAPAWQVREKARMRGARIYARKKSIYTRPPHPNPLPQGERELPTTNKISYAIALPIKGRGFPQYMGLLPPPPRGEGRGGGFEKL